MAKREWDFQAAGDAQLTRREARSIANGPSRSERDSTREGALACFVSGGEGWDKAVRRLDGAFAPGVPKKNGD